METLITSQLTDIASCSELASYNCGVDMRATIASSNFPPSSDFKSSTRFCKELKLIKKLKKRWEDGKQKRDTLNFQIYTNFQISCRLICKFLSFSIFGSLLQIKETFPSGWVVHSHISPVNKVFIWYVRSYMFINNYLVVLLLILSSNLLPLLICSRCKNRHNGILVTSCGEWNSCRKSQAIHDFCLSVLHDWEGFIVKVIQRQLSLAESRRHYAAKIRDFKATKIHLRGFPWLICEDFLQSLFD